MEYVFNDTGTMQIPNLYNAKLETVQNIVCAVFLASIRAGRRMLPGK